MNERNSTFVILDSCHGKDETEIYSNTNPYLLGPVKNKITTCLNNDDKNDNREDIIIKANKLALENSNIRSVNNFEIIIEDDCTNKFEQNSTFVIMDSCHMKDKTEIFTNTNPYLLGSINNGITTCLNNDDKNESYNREDIIIKSNKLALENSNIRSVNNFEIIIEDDCTNKCVQNSTFVLENSCYDKDKIEIFPNTNPSLLGSVNKENTTSLNNDEKNESCIREDIIIKSNKLALENSNICSVNNFDITIEDNSTNTCEQNSTFVITDGCHVNDETEIFSNTNPYLLGSLNNEMTTCLNNDDKNELYNREDIIIKSNKLALENSNICSRNSFEIIIEDDCTNTCVQNSTFVIIDDCHVKDGTEIFSNTNPYLLGSVKKKITTGLNNDDKNESYNIEDIIIKSNKSALENSNINSGNNFEIIIEDDCTNACISNSTFTLENDKSYNREKFIVNSDVNINKKQYTCHTCKISYPQKHYLRAHMDKHTDKRTYYVCDICEKFFSQKKYLNRHKITHIIGNKPYKCNICKASFLQSENLKRHLAIHVDNNELFIWDGNLKGGKIVSQHNKPYKCDICKTTFLQKTSLRRHMYNHINYKPYKCDFCEKSFSRSDVFKIHMVCHTNNKPYKCDVCDKSYSRNEVLKNHIFNKHYAVYATNKKDMPLDARKSNHTILARDQVVDISVKK